MENPNLKNKLKLWLLSHPELNPYKFSLKKSGLAGLFSASLELSREGLITIMQKKVFDNLMIRSKK